VPADTGASARYATRDLESGVAPTAGRGARGPPVPSVPECAAEPSAVEVFLSRVHPSCLGADDGDCLSAENGPPSSASTATATPAPTQPRPTRAASPDGWRVDAPRAQGFLKAHVPAPRLPSLPAKLLAWHVIHQVYRPGTAALGAGYAKGAAVITFLFVFLPFISRGAMGYPVMGASWQTTLLLALIMQQVMMYFSVTLSYIVMGVVDHTRRLDASRLLLKLLGESYRDTPAVGSGCARSDTLECGRSPLPTFCRPLHRCPLWWPPPRTPTPLTSSDPAARRPQRAHCAAHARFARARHERTR
jgi:hypothetical protein